MRARPTVASAVVLLAAVLATVPPPSARAAVLCQKKSGGLALRETCKRRETPVAPASLGLHGPYGDGSAGAREIVGDEVLADGNPQYTDFTVAAGATLTVPSGTTIRLTGAFVNDGVIVVEPGAGGGRRAGRTSAIPAHPGATLSSAQAGDVGDGLGLLLGGKGAPGLGPARARSLLQPGIAGGGGGGTAGSDRLLEDGVVDEGAAGGGSLVVVAAGEILHGGRIVATGGTGGGGGGGGGIIVLASRTRVAIAPGALLGASGGAGEDGDANEAPSGGGGGGIVHVLAPLVDDRGTTDVRGGVAGAAAAAGTPAVVRAAGGGGGASGGDGGNGGDVGSASFAGPAPATPGGPGVALRSEVDPSALF